MAGGRGTESSSAISFVIVVFVLDPARVRATAGRVRVSAVHAVARTWVDVELAVDHEPVTSMNGHVLGEACVVVDLEHLSSRRTHLEPLVIARLHGVGLCRGVESDFCSGAVVLDISMQALVVGSLAAAASGQHERRQKPRREPHADSACSRVILPSYNAFPRMAAWAPAAAMRRRSSTDATPPEYCSSRLVILRTRASVCRSGPDQVPSRSMHVRIKP